MVHEDFDGEDLSREELIDTLVCHPALDSSAGVELPEIGSFVWHSVNQAPRLDKVSEMDPTLSRPVTVMIYDPQPSSADLTVTRFEPRRTEESSREVSGIHDQLFLSQVRFGFQSLTAGGFLRKQGKTRLKKCLSS